MLYAQQPADFVNPFIGTSNYGAAYPGPIAPRGMASISPFNVAGPQNLPLEKDSRWLSNPYVNENKFLTGFSQVNLSGVGCPELGVILLMPTTGAVETNHLKYGSTYSDEVAKTAYYSVNIDKYNVKGAFTASKRVGVSKFTFPKGQSNILLNLGLGLTNEEGAMIKVVSSTEIEGMRSVGSFCYNSPEDAYPVYFVAQFFLLKKYRLLEMRKNKSNSYLVSWFLIYMSSQLLLVLGVLIDNITGLKLFEDPYRFAITMITFFHFSVVLGLLFIPNLFYGMVSTEKELKEKYSSSKLSEPEKNKIINEIIKFFIVAILMILINFVFTSVNIDDFYRI